VRLNNVSILRPDQKVCGLLMLSMCWFSVLAMDDQQWRLNELQVDDGLPDSTVYSVAQDQTGYMWFGTTNGVARYDGYSFKVFQHDGADEATIANNNAGNIYIDSDNQLWIGTFGGGANKMDLDTGRVHRYPYTSSQVENMLAQNVQTFYEDDEGTIWIGTSEGLYAFSHEQPVHLSELIDDHELAHNRIWDITGDRAGNIWAGTSVGLLQYNTQSRQHQHHVLPDELTFDITSNQFRTLEMDDGRLWIGSASGLYEYDLNQQSFIHHAINQDALKINDILIFEDKLLIASMSGMYEFDPVKKAYTTHKGETWSGLGHLDLRALYADPSGLLWLATRDNGVMQLDPKGGLFHHHDGYLSTLNAPEKAKQIWGLEIDQDDQLTLATSETVYVLADDQLTTEVLLESGEPIPGIIRDLATTATGNWIIGSEGVYWQARGSEVAVPRNEPLILTGVDANELFSVAVNQAGELWLALYNVGILRWHPDSNQAELIQQHAGGSLADLNLSHVMVDSQEDVWIASGLVGVLRYQMNTNEIKLYSNDFNQSDGLSSNRIRHLFEDSAGRMWVATERGLNLYDASADRFQAILGHDPVISRSNYAIAEDSQGQLWLANQFGISRLNPDNQQVNHYRLNDNFRVDGFLPRSLTIDQQDVLYLGSVDGYYTFNPNELDDNRSFEPVLAITDVYIDDRPLPFAELTASTGLFELSHKQRSIAVTVAALDFKSAGQLQYQYRLNGLHDNWMNMAKNRRIEFTQLDPGQYRLDLRAINNDGSWQELSKAVSIAVYPVWWERGWVKALLVLTVLALAWSVHFYRTLKIRQQNQRLEAEVQKRTAELSEANAKLKAAAHSDYLTGLNNRMAFVSGFEERRKEHAQGLKNSCIVMADIDHFKLINDQYGHAAGDEVLKQVSAIMKSMIREHDLMARWGGEEFIFYFDRMDATDTHQLIERIRLKIESSDIVFEDQVIPVTLTFGVCQKKAGQSLNDCINAADEALYEGKNSGRNQVVVNQH
jgi:diguanylate cyclase (GGDEF)-like protein